ncbi:obscurin isoform X3 [Dermatophagoides pteronyssinus]|uniref:obscurin isoform X3 n=1 Tax=Dermatophagoides pteronyssinus TaxID=6956 RepID=UPI003F67BEE3
MSYRSYKASASSSSYRYSSGNEGLGTSSTSSSRFRTSLTSSSVGGDDDFGTYSTRRISSSTNYEPSSSLSIRQLDDDIGTSSSRRSYQSSRLISKDYDDPSISSTSRYSSNKYKITSIDDDDDDDLSSRMTSRKYSRYSSRDEAEGLQSATTSRISRYSSLEQTGGDDDYGLSSSTTTRRRTKLSYLDDDDDHDDLDDYKSSTTRKSFRPSLSYDIRTPSTDDIDYNRLSSYSDRRRSAATTTTGTMNRSLSRMDSKEAQIYEVILDYKPPRSATDEICLKEGQNVIVLSKDKPHKWKVRTRKSEKFPKIEEGFAPSAYLKPTAEKLDQNEQAALQLQQQTSITESEKASTKSSDQTNKDLNKKKDMIVRELIETEEDLIRDMQFVVRTYIRQSDSSITPKEIRSVKDQIFDCYKEILEFHKDILLKNFQTLSKEPGKIGKLFIRMQPNFSNHSKYCRNLPKALEILDENSDVAEYFNLPLQRLNDYQLLLKELSKNLSRLDEDVSDLEKAIKLIAAIPDADIDDEDNDDSKKPIDTTTLDKNINDFNLPTGSSEKLSNLLKNVLQAKDFFDVIDTDGNVRERFIFFFKSRMFITEINKNLSADQRTYNVEKIIKLPQVEISDEDANTLIIKSKDTTDTNFPIRLRCQDQERIKSWLKMINSLPKNEEECLDDQLKLPFLTQSTKQEPLLKSTNSIDENNNKILEEKLKEMETEPEKRQAPPVQEVNEEPIQAKIMKPVTAVEKIDSTSIDNQPKQYAIVRDLQSFTKQLGDHALFECQVTPGTINVQWLKDNAILSGTNYRTYKKGDNYYLELNNLTVDDNGIYTFVASDSKTSVASSSTLNVLAGDSRPTSPGGSFLPHPPKFKVKLKDTDLLEGASCVRFELIVRGLPIPMVEIFKDNRRLESNDRVQILFQSKEVFEIVLKNVCQKDAGLYRCVATNPEGQAETSGRITVTKNKDVFFGLDESLPPIPIQRDPHSPRCMSPAFKWFKDGREFEASERFQVQFDDQEDTVALIFQHVTPDDAGLYTCVASTSSGKISCHAELNVQGGVQHLPKPPIAPKFLKELSNIQVCKGQNIALLEAQVIGFPKPSISWYKDDKKIESNDNNDHYKMMTEGDANVTLMIKNVDSNDIGHYRIEAENQLGLVESSARLDVVKKPEFTKALDQIVVDDNQQLIIEQSYDCQPEPTRIQWQKDGQDLAQSKRIQSSVDADRQIVRLVIDKVTSEDAGTYQCMIANTIGSAKQNTQVLIKSSAPKFLRKFEAVQVKEHEKAIFTAQYDSTATDVHIEFYKNDQLIRLDERIKLEKEKDGRFSLIINDTSKDDEGRYKCKIKNNQGSDEADANLIVIKKDSVPEFKEKLQDLQAQLNDENVQLAVKVDGQPPPSVQWFHDGKPINQSDKDLPFKIVDKDNCSTLIIPKVLAEHSGQYLCRSSNSQGQAETAAELIVKSAPYVVKHLDNVDIGDLGQEVKLTAIIKGIPKPDIVWTCNDTKILGKKTEGYDEASCEYSLILHKIQPDDLGEYCIRAKNHLGECESKSQVQLTTKPLFSKVLTNIMAKPMQSNIEFVVELDKNTSQKPMKLKWFKDDQEIKDSDKNFKKIDDKLDNLSHKLIIMKATEEMVGHYKCVASNDFGDTETAARFDLIIPPRFIKGLHDVDIAEGNNVSMTIQLAGFPQPEIKFYKDGEEISTSAHVKIRKEMDDIYQFEIENIRIIMSGQYECRIKNEAGEASSSGVITVNSKPQFLKNLTDQIIDVGDNIQLEVTVTGQPSPQIKWFINGKEAKGDERILFDSREESYSMKIPNAKESDTGEYYCIANNQIGEQKSDKADVKVINKNSEPKISKPIKDSAIVIDDNVRFETVISGTPKPEIIWTKDSVALKPSDRILIKSDGDTHTLIMKNCKQQDSGQIGCQAKNVAGSVMQTAQLEVEEPTIPTIEGLHDKRIVVDGEPVRFEANISGFPKPIVEWFHVDEDQLQPIIWDTDNNQLAVVSEPKQNKYGLVFESFPSKMFGEFVCRATNNAGAVEKRFSVEIGGKKPTFIKELDETQIVMSVDKQNNRMKLGQSAIFETIVDGIPTPSVEWLKNDEPLRANPRVLIESNDNGEHKLEVKTITKDDVAKYTCKAVNKFGEAQTVCLLKFLNEPHEPIIKKPLEDVQIEEGDDLKLFCKVDGEPMPAVRWIKDEQPLEKSRDDRLTLSSNKDGSAQLVIEKVQKSDSGKFIVEAENAKGIARTESKVEVVDPQRPPSFPEPLKELFQVETNKPLILEAKVFGLPPPKIQWLKDGKPISDKSPRIQMIQSEGNDGKCQLKIDHIKPEDAGVYSLKAVNANGEKMTKAKVEVTPQPYAPRIIEDLPVKLQIKLGEPIKLESKIQSYPLAKLTWMKDSIPLSSSDERIKINDNDQLSCLAIDSAKPEDQGTYTLIAANPIGEISCKTQIEILQPVTEEPTIVKDKKGVEQLKKPEPQEMIIAETMPNQQNVAQGDDIRLSMKVSAANDLPSPKITAENVHIYKDNVPLQKSDVEDNLKIMDSGEIQFTRPKCLAEDSGLYRIDIEIPVDQQQQQNLSNSCLVNVISDKDQADKAKDDDKSKYPLKFKQELSSVQVESGQPCRLQCSIDLADGLINVNDLTIGWFKDGEQLVPGEHHGFVKESSTGNIALLIDSFASKDVGEYQVKITDKNSSTIFSSAKASLKATQAKTKPEIIDGLSNVEIEEGSQLCLKCHMAPIPSDIPIQTKWFANGKQLQESDSIKFLNFPDGTIMLQINKIGSSDSGQYKVIISNQNGDATSEAKVSVLKPKPTATKPTIRKGLESTTLIAGETGVIEFQVECGGATDIDAGDIKFLLGSQLITPDDRIHIQRLPDGIIRLKFDKVKLADQGQYTAIFKNDAGSIETGCPVIVKSKPVIISPLEDMAVKEKCSIKFEVKIEANPDPDIVWIRNGSKIQIDGKHYLAGGKTNDNIYTLTINDCIHRDKAEYSVKATNELGTATSKAHLDVLYASEFEECPPAFTEQLHDISAGKGDTVQLMAKVKAHPVPKIVWKKDGQELPLSSDKVFTSFNGEDLELTIMNFDKSDVGIYEVCVGNSLGQTSSTARVVEHSMTKPQFVRKLSDIEARLGSETKLTCRVEGYPKADIEWTFNGRPIESGSKYSIQRDDRNGEQTLIIFEPCLADSGIYQCTASNQIGSDQTSSNVLFGEKSGEAAHFITKLQDCDCLAGSTARFTACVVGNPMPEFKWFKDDKEIEIDGRKYSFESNPNGMITFEIHNIDDKDIGRYRCMASNKFGCDNSVGQLNFETNVVDDQIDRMKPGHKSMKSVQRIKDAGSDELSFGLSGQPKALSDAPIITKMIDNSLTLLWIPSIPEQPRFPVSYVVEFAKISDGIWTVCHGNIKDCKCDVVGLESFEDYGFRVRVENKFGLSDPSPTVTAFRSQLKDHDAHEHAMKATKKPDDYYLQHRPPEKVAAAPTFVRDEHESMFGVIGQPVTIEFWVYGYPEPEITWFFGDHKIDSNDQRFSFMKDRNGKTCLFINRMTDSDEGYYTCLAKNEHGEEKKTIKVIKADAPKFTKLLDETEGLARNHIRLSCSVISSPQATIKWFKDYQPLHDTSRLNIIGDSDNLSLVINDAMVRDSGLYSCTATNLAGSTTTSAYVTVRDQPISYDKYPFSYKDHIKPKNKPMEQLYDIGDELGRGTQGITYHTVERSTGKSYAAKMMYGTGETRQYMNSELDIMNQLGSHEYLVQLHDCFASTPYSMSLITSMNGGGTLMDFVLRKGQINEQEVAEYIRQILEGLHYMHFKNIGHLGLTINDILMQRIDGPDITICDFGLAQRLTPGASVYVEFGQPEFISPEIVDKNSVTLTTDVWSAGIVAHILLTGISPFLGENDRSTMHNILNKNLDLSDDKLGHISEQGRDFLRKTLNFNPNERLDVKAALNHPWIKSNLHSQHKSNLDIMDKLRNYKSQSDKWYQNASCRRYYRRRPLHSCYTHPSRMIYPPGEQYSPLVSPEREMKRFQRNVAPFDNVYPPNQTFGAENFQSESHYQCGPDTYLLQLRDTDFPARIRRYLKIAAANSPSMVSNLQQAYWSRTSNVPCGTFSQPSIKERRKFTDIMDEEINDEIRGKPGRKPRRLAHEVGTPLYLHGQLKTLKKEAGIAKQSIQSIDESNFVMPFFREKLQDQPFQDEGRVVLECLAIGVPTPTYTWFRNDSIIIETNRTKVKRLDDGRCQLILDPARQYDCGVYRCVARNTLGSVMCRARLSLGDVPNNVNAPTIKDYSSHDILLQWSTPKHIADAHIESYRLESKKSSATEWSIVDDNIHQEFYLVTGLEPNQSYQFRLLARNKFGCSDPSPPSQSIQTLSVDADKRISLPLAMQFVCNDNLETTIKPIDYNQEMNPIQLIKSEFKELYDFKSIIATGKFAVIARGYIKDGSRQTLAIKCILVQSEIESAISQEFEIHRSLAHEHIARLMYANRDGNLFTLAIELCSGLNVLTCICRRQSYNEQHIARILCQILDAIQYLHFRNIALLELQPDNVLIVNEQNLQIKLTDFASARYVSNDNRDNQSQNINLHANPEYIAPELIRNENIILPYTDVWSVAVLAYILLSGHSPFKGNDAKETAENVVFVRYLFERLYPRVTQEAIRFLLSVFKLTPHKRPTIDECYENKWLLPNEFMMKKRESAEFDTKQIQIFTEQFSNEKSQSKHSRLLDLIGLNSNE